MILQCDPGGWQQEFIRECKAFFEPVAYLRPTEAHFTLEVQGTCQSARPPPAGQPRAANADQQNHPNARWIDDLHQEGKRTDDGEDFGVQADDGLHRLIIDYMLELLLSN